MILPSFLILPKGPTVWSLNILFSSSYFFHGRIVNFTTKPNLIVLQAHPFQLDCPNSTQSLSNMVDQTFYQHTQEIQKTYDTQLSQFEEKKGTRQDIHNRRHRRENQLPERDQKHFGLKRNKFL